MKYIIEATIPNVQYGNIRPTFEVEDNEEEVLSKLESLWNMFGEQPLPKRTEFGEKLTTFTGEEVYYNDDTHSYYTMSGAPLLSGSQYAKEFAKPFDLEAVSKAVASKSGEPQEVIKKRWELGGSVANSYGTAVHDSVEFILTGGDIEKIPLNIREIVCRIVDTVKGYGMVPLTEVLISDVANGRVGRVDCLLVDNPEKPTSFKIVDYKTNRELKKDKVVVYTEQLKFYRNILTAHGLECQGLTIIHDNGSELKELPLDKPE